MRRFFPWSAVLCSIVLAACQSGGPDRSKGGIMPARDDQARAAGLSEPEISSAKQLYVNKCARCHKFYDPADYELGEWRQWMTKMSRKARLKSDEIELLSRYLEALRGNKN